MNVQTRIRHAQHTAYTIISKLKQCSAHPRRLVFATLIEEERWSERTSPARSAGNGVVLVGRIPDHGQHLSLILFGGTGEIGVELARYKRGSHEREAHIVLAAVLAATDPARFDPDALGDEPKSRRRVSARLSQFRTMSLSARMETVLSWPL